MMKYEYIIKTWKVAHGARRRMRANEANKETERANKVSNGDSYIYYMAEDKDWRGSGYGNRLEV